MRMYHGPIASRPLGDSRADARLGLGPDLEVVVDHRHLAVEQEARSRGSASSDVERARRAARRAAAGTSGTASTTRGPSGCAGRGGRRPAPRRPSGVRRSAAASPPISRPRWAASRAIARWQVTMSVRPSAIPVRGGVPSRTRSWKASSSRSNASSIESKASRAAGLVPAVETTSCVGSWSRYGAGNVNSPTADMVEAEVLAVRRVAGEEVPADRDPRPVGQPPGSRTDPGSCLAPRPRRDRSRRVRRRRPGSPRTRGRRC